MVNVIISDERLQASFENSINALLTPGNYDNPVKKVLDNIFGYSSKDPIKEELTKQITDFMSTKMNTPEFLEILGKAIAGEIAKREIDKMKSK